MEVNAHSLFSKWFSESGKLVNKLFDTIRDLLDDPDVFVCVLIDEVESLTAARKAGSIHACMSHAEMKLPGRPVPRLFTICISNVYDMLSHRAGCTSLERTCVLSGPNPLPGL